MTEKSIKPYRTILIRLEPEMYEALAALAKNERRSVTNLAEFCVVQYVQNQKVAIEDKSKGTSPSEVVPDNIQAAANKPKTVAKDRKRRSLS